MGFGEAIKAGFSNYVNFSGRAVRSEYWYWALFGVLGAIVALILDMVIFNSSFGDPHPPLSTLFDLITLLPSLSVAVRRLQDIDRNGWWILIALTGIGVFVLIYWFCQPGTSGSNRFGPEPSRAATRA